MNSMIENNNNDDFAQKIQYCTFQILKLLHPQNRNKQQLHISCIINACNYKDENYFNIKNFILVNPNMHNIVDIDELDFFVYDAFYNIVSMYQNLRNLYRAEYFLIENYSIFRKRILRILNK